ncbi:hypothetical protein LguiA_026692 [Lonicera macranthoides]
MEMLYLSRLVMALSSFCFWRGDERQQLTSAANRSKYPFVVMTDEEAVIAIFNYCFWAQHFIFNLSSVIDCHKAARLLATHSTGFVVSILHEKPIGQIATTTEPRSVSKISESEELLEILPRSLWTIVDGSSHLELDLLVKIEQSIV